MVKLIESALAGSILLSHTGLIVFFLVFLLEKLHIVKWYSGIKKLSSPYVFYLAFLFTLSATLGSLFLSEIVKLPPCALCWWQRIFMYPQVFLLYTGILKNETIIKPYLMVLNIFGLLIALYHAILLILPKNFILNCSALGGVSCTQGYTYYFGYITIPVMSATAFMINIILLVMLNNKSQITNIKSKSNNKIQKNKKI